MSETRSAWLQRQADAAGRTIEEVVAAQARLGRKPQPCDPKSCEFITETGVCQGWRWSRASKCDPPSGFHVRPHRGGGCPLQ